MTLTLCLSEDRELQEVGLRLALCSIRRHSPGARVVVYRPGASDDFRSWVASGFPNAAIVAELPPGASSWNCKPHVLLPLLRAGHEEVVWVDSDIVLAGPCEERLRGLGPDVLAIAQEALSQPLQGSECRTAGWKLPVGRRLPRTLNSCIVRTTARHIPLLERWLELLSREEYRAYQTRPFEERPIHCLSDQDVLNALLGSEEFASVPIHELRTGVDIIQSGGALAYSARERLGGLFRAKPPFIHGQGTKLWWAFDESSLLQNRGRWWFTRRLILELSPYFAEVKSYRDEVGVPCPWMDYATALGTVNRGLGLGHHALRGLPLTLAATCIDLARRKR